MARHRGTYNPEHESPYEVSRSQIDSFFKCPACFWMNRVKGIKFKLFSLLIAHSISPLSENSMIDYEHKNKCHNNTNICISYDNSSSDSESYSEPESFRISSALFNDLFISSSVIATINLYINPHMI